MDTSTLNYTARVPTLQGVIEWLNSSKDLHAVVHVCSRWRRVAFAHPRRYCWFDCNYQYIAQWGKAQNEACYAQLRCSGDHKKKVNMALSGMSTSDIDTALGLLDRNMGRVQSLTMVWGGPTLGNRVLDTLSRRPAPSLERQELFESDYVQYCAGDKEYTRILSNIFAGDSPRLASLTMMNVKFPEAPLKCAHLDSTT